MKVGGLTLLVVSAALAVVTWTVSAEAESRPYVRFRPATIGLFRRTSVAVTGLSAHSVEMRLRGATDAAGLAYEWTPYRWHRLRLVQGVWRGALPAPALLGIYELQLRLDDGRRFLQSPHWLLRVFRRHTLKRRSFRTPAMVVRDFVGRLPGDEVVVALRRLRPAKYDHRDTRMHRIFAVAYTPRGDSRPSSRLGFFINTARDGLHGRWRLLEVGVQPYG